MMGVNISSQRDSVSCSVDKGGEHINQSEGDSNPIREEKESIEHEGSSELVNPFTEWSNNSEQGFHQIKERNLSLTPSTSPLDPKTDKSVDLITNQNESKEPEYATKVPEVEFVKDQNSKASLMKSVFSMLGISKKTLIPKDNENTPATLDEVLPEDQNLPPIDSVTELLEHINDENKVSEAPLLDDALKRLPSEQNSEEEQKNLMRITGEFPRSVVETITFNAFQICSGFIANLILKKLESVRRGSRKT